MASMAGVGIWGDPWNDTSLKPRSSAMMKTMGGDGGYRAPSEAASWAPIAGRSCMVDGRRV
eukprot:scaffold9100_cov91-Isochrysis_galbana.AAC.1